MRWCFPCKSLLFHRVQSREYYNIVTEVHLLMFFISHHYVNLTLVSASIVAKIHELVYLVFCSKCCQNCWIGVIFITPKFKLKNTLKCINLWTFYIAKEITVQSYNYFIFTEKYFRAFQFSGLPLPLIVQTPHFEL